MRNTFLAASAVWLLAMPLYAADGDWFLVDGKQQPSTNNPRHAAYQKLLERSKAGRPLLGLAFAPNDAWVALCGGTESWGSDTQLPVGVKMRQLSKDPAVREFHGVAFSPNGGWVLLHDRNRFVAEGIPDGTARKLRELADAGTALRAVVFPPTGGWIILGGANGVWAEGVPDAVAQELARLAKKPARITGIAFTSAGDWFILTDHDGVHASRPDHPAVKALAAGGGRWLAFAPGDSATGYVLRAVPGRRIRAVLTTTITMPNAAVEEWYVYAPHAPTFGGQRNVKTTLKPEGQIVHELSPLHRPMLLSRVKVRGTELRPVLSIEATLVARRLLPRPPGTPAPAVADLSADQARLYTRSTPTLDTAAAPLVDWLERHELRRGKAEDEIAFAPDLLVHQASFRIRWPARAGPAAGCSLPGGQVGLWRAVGAIRGGPAPAASRRGCSRAAGRSPSRPATRWAAWRTSSGT